MILSSPAAFAQSEEPDKALEDYIEQEEPAQETLSEPQETADIVQAAETESVVEALEETPSPQSDGDAMPKVETKIRLQTEGFKDYTAEHNFDIRPGNNPASQTSEELAEEIRQEAFDAAITGMFPLRPDDIKSLIKQYDTTRRAAEEPIHGVPTPHVNVETISLDPGVPPMALKTATGHITTLNILDITGAPWPIQDVSWAGDFEVIEPEEGGHVVRIIPMGNSAYGNMSIRLLTLKTPITIMLTTSKDNVQYRVDARIPEFGPFAQTPLIDGGSERVAGNATIMSVLDGTPPGSAERLSVSGVDGRTSAYRISNIIYVRTPLTLLSPGWKQSVSSADGMNVYAVNDTPVLLLSDKGRFTRAGVGAGKDLFDE